MKKASLLIIVVTIIFIQSSFAQLKKAGFETKS